MISGREGIRTQECLIPNVGLLTPAVVPSSRGTSRHLLGLEWGPHRALPGKAFSGPFSPLFHTCLLADRSPWYVCSSREGTGKEPPAREAVWPGP